MLLARPGLPKKWDDSCDDIEEHSPTYRPTQAIYKQLDSWDGRDDIFPTFEGMTPEHYVEKMERPRSLSYVSLRGPSNLVSK